MSDPAVHAMYVLPWLKIRNPIAFGPVEVSDADTILDEPDGPISTVREILGTFQRQGGAAARPSLMWISGEDPLRIEPDDFPRLAACRDYLSAAAIMGNEYCRAGLDSPITDAHCDGYFQRFVEGSEHVSFTIRRRDGTNIDGRPIAHSVNMIPLSAMPQAQFNPHQTLLDAFAKLLSPSTELEQRIEDSLPFFVQANRLDARTSIQYDLVFLGAALERLLGIRTPIAKGLADSLADLFSGFHQGTTSWVNYSASGNPSTDSGPWVSRWARAFYAHRSSIHGDPARSTTWHDVMHGLIATEVYALAVKLRLDQAGLRALTDDDKIGADALDGRIETLADSTLDRESAWWDPYLEAVTRVAGLAR